MAAHQTFNLTSESSSLSGPTINRSKDMWQKIVAWLKESWEATGEAALWTAKWLDGDDDL